jgi:branched-chain amino acid aminotransferase
VFAHPPPPPEDWTQAGVKPAKSVVLAGYDRASPYGVGDCKVAGNYAADVLPSSQASKRGYTVVLYLDAAKHKYVEEFSTSNFVAISKDGKKFLTRLSLETLAADEGLKVVRKRIPFAEVGKFREVAACGTAVVIVPIESFTDEREAAAVSTIPIGDGTFPIMMKLYNRIQAIQRGDEPDKHSWLRYVCDRPAAA